MQQQARPTVVQRAKQVGEDQRNSWIEAAAWTGRMLAALERGVRGGVWFALIDKVYRKNNLEAAYEKVARNGGSAGVDHVTVEDFGKHLKDELARVSESLEKSTYRPQAIRRVYIPKAGGGERHLGIPTVRDRVVQAAVKQVIEPIFEREFLSCSYGFRPNLGCKDALRAVSEMLQAQHTIVVDADIKSFFDTIKHDKLMELVSKRVQDGRMLNLLESFLHQGILEEGEERAGADAGTPQGGVISPLLANIYLHELDKVLMKKGYRLVRYADDFVVLCDSKTEGEEVLALVTAVLTELGLTLHPDKTHIVDMQDAGAEFEFLGYRFKNHKGKILRYPRSKSIAKMRAAVRIRTPRLSGQSIEVIIDRLNQMLRGWYKYFRHSSSNAFPECDSWIRMRLRAILCYRAKCASRRYGLAHKRWPNRYFKSLRLFCLAEQHAQDRCQSATR